MHRRSYQGLMECTNSFLKPSQKVKCHSLSELSCVLKICIQFHRLIKVDNSLLVVFDTNIGKASAVIVISMGCVQFYRTITVDNRLFIVFKIVVSSTSHAVITAISMTKFYIAIRGSF